VGHGPAIGDQVARLWPDRTRDPQPHEPLKGAVMIEEVPLTGLFFVGLAATLALAAIWPGR
jgi:hypothetical protein